MVLEQGERLDPERIQRADHNVREFAWEPALGMYGYFAQHLFRHVGILGGVGVGGGSLVFGGVLLEPAPAFFVDPAWNALGPDWQQELAPHYRTAATMLGRAVTPLLGRMDAYLRDTAEAMGAGSTFGPTPNAIYFGEPGVTHPDPYFGGEGPERTGCSLCGRCLTGCPFGAKNSLDKNYLYLAEKKGVSVRPSSRVVQNRYGPAFEFMKAYSMPLVDDARPLWRALRTVFAFLCHPWRFTRPFRTRQWHRKVTALTVMQNVESTLRFVFGRSPLSPFKRRLVSRVVAGQRPPTYLAVANRAARILAAQAGGEPFNILPESLGNLSITAHILGGCAMGKSVADGVVDTSHQVFGYPGLYVVDGAAVPANVGVNPSLTITAMAERCMSAIPHKD